MPPMNRPDIGEAFDALPPIGVLQEMGLLITTAKELIEDEWSGMGPDSSGGRWLARYAEWRKRLDEAATSQ